MKVEYKNFKTLVFIIDQNFRIVYSNDEFKKIIPEEICDRHCYEIFVNNHHQCERCPLKNESEGTSILYSPVLNEWLSVNSASIDYPGVGDCHIIIANILKKDEKNFFHNAASTSKYDELLELNYSANSYNIAYHGVQKKAVTATYGEIDTMVRHVAENNLHPDDRERFYNFWLLDQVGMDGIPEDLFTTRHAEFRKLMADGSYKWVQQIMVPIRQNSENSIFINSFYNIIDMPVSQNLPAHQPVAQTLYNKSTFFHYVDEVLKQSDDDTHWSMIAIDIEKFKLYNEWYGNEAGDKLLNDLSIFLKNYEDNLDGIAGYLGNDDFALFTTYDASNIKNIYHDISELIKNHSNKMHVLPAFGIYEIVDHTTPAFRAYDRANLACTSVKNNYASRIKLFDHEMLQSLQSEYLLLSDIQKAFQNKEFTFYLQPKCDMATGKIIGAEALARWISKKNGMISPGVFIPFLEKSGFIAELDTYIWEEVCKWQRSMLDRGLETLPVSVNISRADLYSVDVPSYFLSLIEKYALSPRMIEIEITENAYAEDNGLVNQTVEKLRNSGFHVLMDDFGSAYSSLNMLKDISVDTLKIDMRFLNFTKDNASKGIDILETVCNMANILGLGIVVEGIETEEHKNFLLKMKCRYGQGFYFYRPLSVPAFEKELIHNQSLNIADTEVEKFEQLYLKDLLGTDIFSEIMINNMLGAVVFYDVYDGEINILRYNEQYSALVGNATFSASTKVQFGKQLYPEDAEKIFQMFRDAQNNRQAGSDIDIRRRRPDGTDMWIHLKTFFLHKQNDHSIFYSSASDVTKIYKTNETLRFFNNGMPGGYFRHTNDITCNFTHISQRFLDIVGFTENEIQDAFDNKLTNMIHPNDRASIEQSVLAITQNGGYHSQSCRIRSKHGYIPVVIQRRLVQHNGFERFQGIILSDLNQYKWLGLNTDDIVEDHLALQTMPCGIFFAEADDDHSFEYISNSLLSLLGYTKQEFLNKFHNNTIDLICEDDRERIHEEILEQLQHSSYTSVEYRIELADGSLKWFYSRGHLITDENGKRWFSVCIVDYDYLKDKY